MKVTIRAGLTLPGPKEYSSIRSDVEFVDVDLDGDLKAQFEGGVKAIEEAEEYIDKSLAQQTANISGLSLEGLGVATELKKLKDKLNPWAKGLTADIKGIKVALEKAGYSVEIEEKEEEKPKKRGRPKKEDK
ncbi:hypothetical protein LCGC14_2805560 [marine sediment metagenome]|uniref:Uncharacterized protein n=1 Tax=marine sediment metagenome TaxID=412755 RepID=A0A0F8Z865_9ZZZZ